ncbi:MAG TPA: hypothetical protein PKJ08_03400 [Candidatus Cloacimonadota bacterium]|jgi:hypothetical protein|nr:hypothetical protein [Candidatus Cloacimonadota bacterium]HOD53554.1 hypothetical protein [Candidatus Cloacimonadota bacterium]HPM02334.1 hypothetical protein [Candidatus Cloacimonadota bacterium]
MHLRVLRENEKKGLLELAYYLFHLDGEFDEHEKNYISIFSHATMLDLVSYQPSKKSLQQILLPFRDSSVIVKEVIFYELVFLSFKDHIPTEKELRFIETLKKEWNMNEEKYKEACRDAQQMQIMQKKHANAVENV